MFEWMIENKEWVFSGVGTALVATVVGVLLKRQPKVHQQEQKAGDGAQQVQVNNSENVNVQVVDAMGNTSSQWPYDEDVAISLQQLYDKGTTFREGSCSVEEVIEWIKETEALLKSKLPRDEFFAFKTCTKKPPLKYP